MCAYGEHSSICGRRIDLPWCRDGANCKCEAILLSFEAVSGVRVRVNFFKSEILGVQFSELEEFVDAMS